MYVCMYVCMYVFPAWLPYDTKITIDKLCFHYSMSLLVVGCWLLAVSRWLWLLLLLFFLLLLLVADVFYVYFATEACSCRSNLITCQLSWITPNITINKRFYFEFQSQLNLNFFNCLGRRKSQKSYHTSTCIRRIRHLFTSAQRETLPCPINL